MWSQARLLREFHGYRDHIAVIINDVEYFKFAPQFDVHKNTHHDGHTPLSLAIFLDRIEIVLLMFQNGANPNSDLFLHSGAVGFFGPFALKLSHWVTRCGNAKIFEMLLSNGLDVNSTDRGCATPVQRAAQGTEPAILALLLKAGADADEKGPGRVSHPVLLAAANENEAMLGLLLAVGVDRDVRTSYDESLAVIAAANPNEKVMEMIFAANISLETPKLQRSPCHVAALNPNEKVLAMLLAAGCDPNQKDFNGETACHLAAKNSNAKVLAMLLEAGADARVDGARRTPLHIAAANTNDAVISTLLAANVDLHDEKVVRIAVTNPNERVLALLVAAGVKLRNFSTLRIAAAANPNGAVMRMLLDAGGTARINKVPLTHSDSALWIAANRGSEAVVAMLIAAGAKDDAVKHGGVSICHVAAENRDAGVMRQLIASGAEIDALNDDDKTPCRIAVEASNLPVVAALLEAGADVNSADDDGVTLCHRAAKLADASILRLLIRHGAQVDVVDERLSAPAHFATAESVAVLFAVGADLDACDETGATPCLQAATSMDQTGEPLLSLLAAGADVNVADKHQRTVVNSVYTTPLRSLKRGLLEALGHPCIGILPSRNLVAWSSHAIRLRQFELVRLRGVEICIGLQARQLSANELCMILEQMPNGIVVPFHKLWTIATTVKHFLDRRHGVEQ
jgi:ankyrin repeat protein